MKVSICSHKSELRPLWFSAGLLKDLEHVPNDSNVPWENFTHSPTPEPDSPGGSGRQC